MYRVIGGRGCGKTSQLMLLAKEQNALIACSNPNAMRKKLRLMELQVLILLVIVNYFQKITIKKML